MKALLLLMAFGSLQSYGPYARPWRGGNHSVVSARGHVLLAWSENTPARIRVVMLDSSGRAISPIRELPALNPSRDALVPAVGTDGTSFVVIWEEALGVQQTVAVSLDSDGTPIGEPHALTNDVPIPTVAYENARVQWIGDEYKIITGTNAYVRVDANATALGVADPASFANVSVTKTLAAGPGGHLTFPPTYWTYVVWRADSKTNSTLLGIDVELSAPVIARAGDRHVIVWSTNGAISIRYTDAAPTRTFAADADASSRPRIACGSKQCVIVYATKANDINGFLLDHTSPNIAPVPFTAAASPWSEREPEVTMPNDARALITWRGTEADGEHLTGRPLLLGGKQRAVR